MSAALAEPLSTRITAAAAGDRAAYASLVESHRRLVASISLAIIGEVAASEDVAQEVFVAAWHGLGKLENPASFVPWIRQMTRNRAHKWVEARRRRREDGSAALDDAPDHALATEARLVQGEEDRALREALDALPDESREILLLFYREGQSVRQVAELLDLSEAAAKKRLSRAREKLRHDLLVRFGEAAERTAPGESFSRGVLAALPGAKGSALLVPTSALGGALAGGAAGLAGVVLGTGALVRRARDRRERNGMLALGAWQVTLLLVIGIVLPRCGPQLLLPLGALAIVTLDASILLFVPRIARRRLAAEREEDARAVARQRRDWRLGALGMALGSAAALAALLAAHASTSGGN